MNDEYQHTIERSYIARVARELQDPNSPTKYLVHVRNRDTLTEVADWINLELMARPGPGPNLTPAVQGLASRGILKVSSYLPLLDLPEKAILDPKDLSQFTFCDMIRVRPYCLVTNPGVFQEQIKTSKSMGWNCVHPSNERDYGHEH